MVRRSPTLAHQAAVEVMDGIRTGALAGEDGLLPSEATLSLRLGVSRATLREALSQLEHGGVIVRRHGIGTFVSQAQPLLETGLEQLESIETLARRTGVEIHMGECDIRERAATPAEAAALGLEGPAGATPVLAVDRVMLSGDQPIAFLVDVVPTDLIDPTQLRESFHGSVLDLLLRLGHPPLQHSSTELAAEAADAALGRALLLPLGSPLLRLTAQLYAADGRVVDYSVSYFAPGHFRFHVIRRVSQLAPVDSTPTGGRAATELVGATADPSSSERESRAVSP